MTNANAITVQWGDGSYTRTGPGGTVTKTYTVAGNYTVSLSATDDLGLASTTPATWQAVISMAAVSGTVMNGSAPVSLVKMTLTGQGVNRVAYTGSGGIYAFANVKPGSGYTLTAVKGTTTYTTTTSMPFTVIAPTTTVNFTQ
jgi:hypothetical protein